MYPGPNGTLHGSARNVPLRFLTWPGVLDSGVVLASYRPDDPPGELVRRDHFSELRPRLRRVVPRTFPRAISSMGSVAGPSDLFSGEPPLVAPGVAEVAAPVPIGLIGRWTDLPGSRPKRAGVRRINVLHVEMELGR